MAVCYHPNDLQILSPQTLMPIGSMTKAMTASMIGELVAEGKLDWDKTPVSEYVPEAQLGPVLTSELTLSDYLSHRTVRITFVDLLQLNTKSEATKLIY